MDGVGCRDDVDIFQDCEENTVDSGHMSRDCVDRSRDSLNQLHFNYLYISLKIIHLLIYYISQVSQISLVSMVRQISPNQTVNLTNL